MLKSIQKTNCNQKFTFDLNSFDLFGEFEETEMHNEMDFDLLSMQENAFVFSFLIIQFTFNL